MKHRFECRVYYEDTDFAGIVYYANYLKFIERGRSELVRELGIDQKAMKRDTGTVFAVRRVEADYLKPARYDDMLTIETRVSKVSGAQFVMPQEVTCDGVALFSGIVTVVCLAPTGKPTRIPADIRRKLLEFQR